MSFLVFILVLIFATTFVGLAIQAKRLAEKGKNPFGLIPGSLVRKISMPAYCWTNGIVGWVLVILGAVIYNSDSKKFITDPGGPAWAAIYFLFITAIFAFFWLRNRHVELKP